MISEEEYKAVYDAHFDAIRRYVFYRYGDKETASDIVQDVFLKVWENRRSLSNTNLTALLYRMATDYANMNYRKQQSRLNFEQNEAYEDQTDWSPEDEMLYGEVAAEYAKALERMPDKQRAAFLLSREDGMKYAEIADTLQVSVKSVEKYITTALKVLRKKLL
jgi:RNA polymerase sigma-70 factor (ECF subfamily)